MSDYHLSEVEDVDVESMLVEVDESMLDITGGLDEVADELVEIGEQALADVVFQAIQDAQNMKGQLDHAIGMIDALQKGMLAIKEQRDDFVQQYQSLKDALEQGNVKHPMIVRAVEHAFQGGCEAASFSFLNDLEYALKEELGLEYQDAHVLAMALYCFPSEQIYEPEDETQMPEEGKRLMRELLQVLKREGWGGY